MLTVGGLCVVKEIFDHTPRSLATRSIVALVNFGCFPPPPPGDATCPPLPACLRDRLITQKQRLDFRQMGDRIKNDACRILLIDS